MSSISMISLSYRGSEKTVALFPGLDADELNRLLQAVFFLPSGSAVVGFLAEVSSLQHNHFHSFIHSFMAPASAFASHFRKLLIELFLFFFS